MKHKQCRTSRYAQWVSHLLILLLVTPPDLLANRQVDPQAAMTQSFKQEVARLESELGTDGILDRYDYEAAAIVEFLQDEIVFQPYSGILRGIDGTLRSRAGNAHDQALTLASLLNDAGYEAQILQATLSPAQAAELVESTAAIKSSKASDTTQLPEFLDAVAERLKKEGRRIETLNAESDVVAGQLLTSLDASWDAEPAAQIMEAAKTASLSYRWVRWRTGPNMQWTEVHPAFLAAHEWGLKPSSIDVAEVDSADLQKLAVSVTVETTDGKRENVSGKWQMPVANLNEPLSIAISSNAALKPDLWTTPEQLVAQSRIFFVQINKQVLKDAKLFDLDGRFYSRAALDGLGSLFDTLGQKGGGAAKALGALGGSKTANSNPKAVQRVVLNFTLSAPDGTEQQVERVLYDRNDTAMNQPAAGQLIQQWSINTATAPLVRSAHQLNLSQGALEALNTYQSMAAHFGNDPTADMDASISLMAKSAENQTISRLSYLRQVFDSYALVDRTSYFPYANILALRQGLRHKGDKWLQYEMTDIVANSRWSFHRNETRLEADPATSVKHGVWETFVETLHLLPPADGTIERTSAYQRLAGADALTIGPAASSQHLTRAPTGGGQQNAWWQVDRRTGTTVGMMQTAVGLGGAELAETAALMNIILVGMSGVFAAVGTMVCTDSGGSFSCCAMANAGIAYIGYLVALPAAMIGAVTVPLGGTAGAVGLLGSSAATVVIEVGMTQITVNCQ